MRDIKYFAFETITVSSANGVSNLTSTVFTPATGGLPCNYALLTVNPGPIISYLLINTATVTSTNGHKMTVFGSFIIEGYDNIKNFQTTSVSSGTTASISVSYARVVNT